MRKPRRLLTARAVCLLSQLARRSAKLKAPQPQVCPPPPLQTERHLASAIYRRCVYFAHAAGLFAPAPGIASRTSRRAGRSPGLLLLGMLAGNSGQTVPPLAAPRAATAARYNVCACWSVR